MVSSGKGEHKHHADSSEGYDNRQILSDSTKRAIAQYAADTHLHAAFEQSSQSRNSFTYSESVRMANKQPISGEQISAYLSVIQRGGLVQPFGCLLAIEESTFKILAYSENTAQMLELLEQPVSSGDDATFLLGTDVRSLFTSSSVAPLEKALCSREIMLSNPIWVHAKDSGKPFYAILHRIDVGIVIDLEPGSMDDHASSVVGAAQAQRLAVNAISYVQALPGGDVNLLCDTVAERVRELTGYDRVMVYMFHEDEHGEVISESKREDLESYLGLHYPATDIPQTTRFLFKQECVRTISDCNANPVGIIQDKSLTQPLFLVGSTLRAPHNCHAQYMANMGVVASLALAVTTGKNEEEAGTSTNRKTSMKLWGLVVCHHYSPRLIPFPLRYACEFLMQAFGLQLNMELQLASQLSEKRILRTQTLLCDMLFRGSPTEIVTKSPSIMDLIKCDGAAMYHQGKYHQLGVTPTEAQINDLIRWLLSVHGDSTGLSTDSLADAGYNGATDLSETVCGMAVVIISQDSFLFWFRLPTSTQIKWCGARHQPGDKDNDQIMHPRSSFRAFLEVVKHRSLPWENAEMDAIHSLQIILRDSFQAIEANNSKALVDASHSSEVDLKVEELSSVAREMVRLIETATAPIFAVDSDGRINGWNAKVAELTGLPFEEAVGKSLVHDVVCFEYLDVVGNLLFRALQGEEDRNVEIKLRTFGFQRNKEAIFLVINTCSSKDSTNTIIGACFVGQDVTEQKVVMDKFKLIQGDYKAIVQSPNPLIPPIFASDENICCSEWNTAMEKLTGWLRCEMIGKILIGDVFGSRCRFRSQDDLTKFMILLNNVISGQDADKLQFSFFNRNGKYVQALLTAYKRVDMNGQSSGAFCFLQIVSPELQQVLEIQRQQERLCSAKMKELAYISQEIKNPLGGMQFANMLLEDSVLSDNQRQLLETSIACERQMTKILRDFDLDRIEDGSMMVDNLEFLLGNVLNAVISQMMFPLQERGLQLIRDIPENVKILSLYGDQFMVQLVLSHFLSCIIQYAPSADGWVEIQVKSSLKHSSKGGGFAALEFRMISPGIGLPAALIQGMFHSTQLASQESLGLSISRKLLKLMNGEIQYIMESDRCFFLILLELPTS